MSRPVDLHAADRKHIIIGDDCLVSWNPWILTSDLHPMYDSTSKKRINPGKSVLVGDHVWIGQGVTILKGSVIGSGAIVGSKSTLTGKSYSSNALYVGSPAREIKRDVFFTKQSINYTDSSKLESTNTYSAGDYIYNYDREASITIDDIDTGLAAERTTEERLLYIKECLAGPDKNKNRFSVI